MDPIQLYNALRDEIRKHWDIEFDTPEFLGFWDDSGGGMRVIYYDGVCEAIEEDPELANPEYIADLYEEVIDSIGIGDAILCYLKEGRVIPDWLIQELNSY